MRPKCPLYLAENIIVFIKNKGRQPPMAHVYTICNYVVVCTTTNKSIEVFR
jgi:hypothetical protein